MPLPRPLTFSLARLSLGLAVFTGLVVGASVSGPVAAAAPSAPTQARVLEQMKALPGLQARYREEKHFALLAEPLVSEGVIHFMPPNRLVRRQTSPQPATVVIDGSKLAVRDAQGAEQVDLDKQPVVAAFVASFMRLLGGDAAGLEKLYETSFAPASDTPHGWSMTLRPRDAAARRLVERIVVQGQGPRVDKVEIFETAGDRTVMRFFEVDLARRYSAAEQSELLGK